MTFSEYKEKVSIVYILEDLGFRAIGRVLNISYGTVFQWIKKWGEKAELPKSDEAIEIVELDEIHTYIERKKLLLGLDCC